MKQVLAISLVLLLTSLSSAFAQRAGDQGYGVLLGNPTGLSGKYWVDERWAFDGMIGVARGELDLHVTALWHQFGWAQKYDSGKNIFKRIADHGRFPFYLGVGPRLLFEDKEELGIRFGGGLSFLPNQSDWEVFTEFFPVLRLTPDVGLNGDFGVGIRYYFKAIRPLSQETRDGKERPSFHQTKNGPPLETLGGNGEGDKEGVR